MTHSAEAPTEPTWFPDAHTSPEDAQRWLKEHGAWALLSDPSEHGDEDES